ncbi:MAG: prenyltransferase [Bacteroidales bacterium]|nr:prenyltransferase [Bacteroidales bacterium]
MKESFGNRFVINQFNHMELIISVFTYFLGSGLAFYLGRDINWGLFILGLSWVFLLLGTVYLPKYYFDFNEPWAVKAQMKVPLRFSKVEKNEFLRLLLLATLSLITVLVVITFLIVLQSQAKWMSVLLTSTAILLGLIYAIPPLRIVYSGFGELIEALVICGFVPFFAFQIQVGTFHQLVPFFSFAIVLLFLCMKIIQNLKRYATDLKYERKSMVTQMGWERGMQLHNGLLILAIIVLTSGVLLKLSWKLSISGLLLVPFGAIQIWQMFQIASGQKPKWLQLSFLSFAILILALYQISFVLWIG